MSKNFKDLIESFPIDRQQRIKGMTNDLLKEIIEAEEALKSGLVSVPDFHDAGEMEVWLKANAQIIAS